MGLGFQEILLTCGCLPLCREKLGLPVCPGPR